MRWKLLTHLRSYPLNPPGCAAPLGRNDAVGLQHLADVPMIALTIELGIGQNQANGEALMGAVNQGAQGSAVVRWAAAGRLGQDHPGVDIHGHGPLQPVAPGEAVAASLGALHKEGADRPRRKTRRIHRHSRLEPRLRSQPLDDGTQGVFKGCLVEPAEKAVHGGLVGPRAQPQGRA